MTLECRGNDEEAGMSLRWQRDAQTHGDESFVCVFGSLFGR